MAQPSSVSSAGMLRPALNDLAAGVDIVIVGGGMAAVMAALAAKQPDNRVLIIEPSNVLGGQGTAGGVAGFCGDSERVNREFAGLVARLSRHGFIAPYRPNDDRRAYDLEWCAFFLQEMVAERGVAVLLHSRVVGAQAKDGAVRTLTVATGGGLVELAPRFVIDASGACVVPLLTGFPVEHEGANRQLPMSLYFTLWDTGAKVVPVLPEGCPRWAHDDEIPMTSLHRFPTGKVEVKMKVVGFDAADGLDRSAAEIFARRQMHGLIFYLQTIGYKGVKLDTHVLASVSRGIGVREERRIVGEHVLTEAEARRAVIFPDAVAVNTYHIDFHWPDRMERAGTGITDMLDPHHLPLRMMIPRGARNLLVPGRGASGDQTAMSAYRVMAVVAQMGYAAGQAARLCVETGADVSTLDIGRLQAAIRAGGQSLDLSDYGDYLRYDLFTQEWLPLPAAPEGSPALVQLDQGRFLAAWLAAGRLWLAERREKRWREPRGSSVPAGCAAPVLWRAAEGGLVIELQAAAGGVLRADSADEGATWSGFAAAESSARPALRTAAGATLAVVTGADPDRAEIRVRLDSASDSRRILGSPLPLSGATALAMLDDGTVVLVGRGADGLVAALSPDGGATWAACRRIEPAGGAAHRPAAVATRTGLAVLAVDGDRLYFWHGSPERILLGPPKASAHALQA